MAHAWVTIAAAMIVYALWPSAVTLMAAIAVIGARQLGLVVPCTRQRTGGCSRIRRFERNEQHAGQTGIHSGRRKRRHRAGHRRVLAERLAAGERRSRPVGFTRLRVVESTLTIDGKTGLAYRIEQDDGTLGYTGAKGQRFQVALENGTSVPLSIHWHGLILANGQDGVPYVTQLPLEAGERRLYDFPIVQAGTYWMHSHFGLQEQQLMTAPLILRDPAAPHPEEQEGV